MAANKSKIIINVVRDKKNIKVWGGLKILHKGAKNVEENIKFGSQENCK